MKNERAGRGRPITSTRTEMPDRADLLPAPIAPYTRAAAHQGRSHLSFLQGGGHGGSHPHLVHEFVRAKYERSKPAVDAVTAARWTAAGVCAHQSAMLDGTGVEIPDFSLQPRLGPKVLPREGGSSFGQTPPSQGRRGLCRVFVRPLHLKGSKHGLDPHRLTPA